MNLTNTSNNPIDAFFENTSGVIGSPPDHLKLIFILLISCPLSLVYPLLPPAPSPAISLYSIFVSFIFLTQILHLYRGFAEFIFIQILTWAWVKWRVESAQKQGKPVGKNMPWEVFAFTMGHLTFNHLIRHIWTIPLDVIEITGSQMVLVMKLSSYAWNVYDGQRPVEKLDSTQVFHRIEKIPSLLDFLGYCFFVPSVMVGPSFTYAQYVKYQTRALFNLTPSQKLVLPPGRYSRGIRRLLTGLFYLAIFALYGGKYGYWAILEPGVESWPLWKRILFLNLGGFMARVKYYAVWCMAESGFIMSGLAWDPLIKKYTASRNLKIRQIEFAQSFKEVLDHWNMNTNVWLRECVYKRVTPEGKKPGFMSTLATFGTSAFWHGLNPCYYLTFLLGAFAQNLGRTLRATLRPLFLTPGFITLTPKGKPPQTALKTFYDVIGIICVQLVLNYAAAPFVLLEVGDTFKAWGTTGYYGFVMIFGPVLLFRLGLGKFLKGIIVKREKAAVEAKGKAANGNGKAVEGAVNEYAKEVGPKDILEDLELPEGKKSL